MPDELPPLDGGSCEIFDVYESLEQLCKIVRFSNTAILKGDRNKSYRVMEDALDLFGQMGNQKGKQSCTLHQVDGWNATNDRAIASQLLALPTTI